MGDAGDAGAAGPERPGRDAGGADVAAIGRVSHRRSLLRVALLLGLFLVCTGAGVWWASPGWSAVTAAWAQILQLSWWSYPVVAGLALAVIAAEVVRYAVMARALGVRLGLWAALDATVASNFFSWITPGAALGEPAATYMLTRHGVAWDAALLIAFGKFVISFVVIFGLGAVFVALGLGPPIPAWLLIPITSAVGSTALLLLALLVGAFWPARTISWITRCHSWLSGVWPLRGRRARRAVTAVCETGRDAVQRLAHFRHAGRRLWLAILLSHVGYHTAFVGLLVVVARGFHEVALAQLVPTAVLYQGFLYLSPTPGSAGIGEASADVFFGALLPGGAAFATVVVFRALSYYLHVLIGLIYLPLSSGGRDILLGRARASRPAGEPDAERATIMS